MAVTDITAAFSVANKISGSAHRQVQEDFEILPGHDANVVRMIGYGSPVRVATDMKFEWIVDEYKPFTVQINNGAGYADSDTSVVVDDAGPVQIGHLLKIGDETARITAVNYGTNTLTIVRSTGAAAAEAIVDNQVLQIVSPSYLDTDSFPTSTQRRGDFKYNYPQQIMYGYSETVMESAETNYLTGGDTQLQYTRRKHMVEALREFEHAVLYNEKVAPTGSVAGQFDGIDAMITDNVNTAVGLLTASKIVNILDAMWVDGGGAGADVTIILNHATKRVFDAVLGASFSRQGTPTTNEVGVTVDRFLWNGGTLDFLLSHFVKDGHAFFLRPADVKIHPLDVRLGAGPGWNESTRTIEHTDALTNEIIFWGLFTMVMREERRHGKMKGITTTLSSYPGAV